MDSEVAEPMPVVVGIGNFDYSGGFRFESTTLKRFNGEFPKEYELRPGDMLLAMTCQTADGEILGVPGRIPDDGNRYLHNQRLGLLQIDDETRLDAGYFFQFARSRNFNRQLFASASGSKILHTSPGRIEDALVPIPPLGEQRAIAATLGALDDKIESNRRGQKVLDELARAQFLKWRYAAEPAEKTTFGAFADVFGGATPRTNEPANWDGEIVWLTPTDVTKLRAPYSNDSTRKITQAGLASCAAVLHPPGTIFMTSRATIGAFAISQVRSATNQGFIAVRPRLEHDRWFIFEEMRLRVDEFRDNANGSTFLELSRGRFKELPLSVPTITKRQQLFELLDPLHVRAAALEEESSRLQVLRDALLPELLSGRIRVTDAA